MHRCCPDFGVLAPETRTRKTSIEGPRDREGGGDNIPKKRKLVGATETQLYGSSWNAPPH